MVGFRLHTTPDLFKSALEQLQLNLKAVGKDPDSFPNAIASTFCYVTEDRSKAEKIVREVIGPALNRPETLLRERPLVGPAEDCANKIFAYQEAGAQRIFLWPVADEIHQLEILMDKVATLVSRGLQ